MQYVSGGYSRLNLLICRCSSGHAYAKSSPAKSGNKDAQQTCHVFRSKMMRLVPVTLLKKMNVQKSSSLHYNNMLFLITKRVFRSSDCQLESDQSTIPPIEKSHDVKGLQIEEAFNAHASYTHTHP